MSPRDADQPEERDGTLAERLREWLLQSRAIELARREAALDPVGLDGKRASYVDRAAELARIARDLTASVEEGGELVAALAALSLSSDAAYWALAALGDDARETTSLGDLWPQIPLHLVAPPVVELARGALVDRDVRGRASLGERAPEAAMAALTLVTELVAEARRRLDPVGPVVRQRLVRIGATAALLLGLLAALGGAYLRVRYPERAVNATWTVSAPYGDAPPSGRGLHAIRPSGPFFIAESTQSPWILFDLGVVARVNSFRIKARGDCCSDQSYPIAIEVSVDGKAFAEVAHTAEPYAEWAPKVPSREARYVRIRRQSGGVLALNSVEIR